MADPKDHFEPLDPGRIDTQSDDELHYWSKELHCTEARLRDVVARVGNHVTAVRDYLGSHRRAGTSSHAPRNPGHS